MQNDIVRLGDAFTEVQEHWRPRAIAAVNEGARAGNNFRNAQSQSVTYGGNGPVFDGNKVSCYMQVEGLGDFLPKYAGNLDIMTAAALRTAEMFAEEAANGTITLPARG